MSLLGPENRKRIKNYREWKLMLPKERSHPLPSNTLPRTANFSKPNFPTSQTRIPKLQRTKSPRPPNISKIFLLQVKSIFCRITYHDLSYGMMTLTHQQTEEQKNIAHNRVPRMLRCDVQHNIFSGRGFGGVIDGLRLDEMEWGGLGLMTNGN